MERLHPFLEELCRPLTALVLKVDIKRTDWFTNTDHPSRKVLDVLIEDTGRGWPVRELDLYANAALTSHEDGPRSAWTRQRGSKPKTLENVSRRVKHWALEDLHGNGNTSRHLYSREGLASIIEAIPLQSLHAIFISSDFMEQWKSLDKWSSSFASAGAYAVRRLTIPLLNVLPLLQTLVRDRNGEFLLFPALEVIVILGGVPADGKGDRYLALKMWLLHVVRTRKRAQKPVREVLVEGKLKSMDVWEDMAEETDVAFF